MSATLIVLHSVQPLTSQLVMEKLESIRILTDDVSASVTATDQPPSVEVVVAPRESWLSKLWEWTASGPVEVTTNDEYRLTYCARLRDDLGLESRHPLQLDHDLDKVSMKRALESAGLLVPLWADLDVVPAAGASLPSDLVSLSWLSPDKKRTHGECESFATEMAGINGSPTVRARRDGRWRRTSRRRCTS